MLHLIPEVKELHTLPGTLSKTALRRPALEPRLEKALEALPLAPDGADLTVRIAGDTGEGYTLTVRETAVTIEADGPAGAFYAIQTLRQLFSQGEVPCLRIRDWPDFPHRGFYHDVTRGKVPTVDTLKGLIDTMAQYKLNSLQLYVEHTFPFAETQDLVERTGCLTPHELRELDEYCRDNFIEFIPSLSTFGHMYEILEQPRFRHLRVLDPYTPSPNFWRERMGHHTIDPTKPESIALVRSLIHQYAPCFRSSWFNICCDETFDLKLHSAGDTGRLYVDFVKQIIAAVRAEGRQVMMWADILLQHPEVIGELPEDTVFLNWNYSAEPPESNVEKFAALGRKQIVCPGTTTWNRLCENVAVEEQNICRMADYGHRHGAIGVLNTNWGDWGNPCSLELAMYGLVLGAAKSWAVATCPGKALDAGVDALLYRHTGAMALLRRLSGLIAQGPQWRILADRYFSRRYGTQPLFEAQASPEAIAALRSELALLRQELREPWEREEYRRELLLAAEGADIMAELTGTLLGLPVPRTADIPGWLARFEAAWLQKNKPSELDALTEMFRFCHSI